MNAITPINAASTISDINTIELTDSYKISHWKQYPKGTSKVFSFFESRGGVFDTVSFFGLQYILKRYLAGPIVTRENVDEAREDFAMHLGNPAIYNDSGWDRILNVHGGRLPILIRAVPEGTPVPTHNVLMTVENTDPEMPWVTNYAETLLSQVWYPSTVATQSNAMRALVLKYLERTGDPSLIDFKVHDFGFRGSTSVESAGIGGAAHLVSFKGTDTLQALRIARKYYGERMAGFSVPAAEHSTITSWGREHEVDAVANMLQAFPTGLVSIVGDSYDIYHFCRHILGVILKDMVLNRDGVTVVRPDSGYPPEVVVKVLDILGAAFGYTLNGKGYKVLNPKVRVIQGDGIDYQMMQSVLFSMELAGWSTDNIVFGSGGGLLQKVNRDTQKFSFKCSAVEVNGVWQDVMKDPVTDPGKKSKAGRLALVRDDESYKTVREEEATRLSLKNELLPVFNDGFLLSDQSFAEIRGRAIGS